MHQIVASVGAGRSSLLRRRLGWGGRALRVWLALVAIAACRDRPVLTDPLDDLMAPAREVTQFMPALADVQTRVIPQLADRAAATRIDADITQLTLAMLGHGARASARAIDAARADIDAYPASEREGDSADLAAVSIALDDASKLVGLAPLPNRIGG